MEKIAGVFGKPLKNKENDLQGDEDDDDEDVSFHGYKEFYTKRVTVLLDTHLTTQEHIKVKFSGRDISSLVVKELRVELFFNLVGSH